MQPASSGQWAPTEKGTVPLYRYRHLAGTEGKGKLGTCDGFCWMSPQSALQTLLSRGGQQVNPGFKVAMQSFSGTRTVRRDGYPTACPCAAWPPHAREWKPRATPHTRTHTSPHLTVAELGRMRQGSQLEGQTPNTIRNQTPAAHPRRWMGIWASGHPRMGSVLASAGLCAVGAGA